MSFQDTLRPFLEREPDAYDYLEVVPDTLWTDRGPGAMPRYLEDQDALAFVRTVRSVKPVIPHSIGLSIGSAHRFDQEHVDQIASWWSWLRFPWHSDHLAFSSAEGATGAGEVSVGLMLPVAYTEETLQLLAGRVATVRRRVPAPFLLENNVDYVQLQEADYDEAGFLNELCARTGCYLLLDLHNLYANSRNHRFDPFGFLERLDLGRVVELHVAGGMEYEGIYLDAHSGVIPEAVWALLQWVLPHCPNAGGVTFEVVGSWVPVIGLDRLRTELARLRSCWLRQQPDRAPSGTGGGM